jgi:uncharacterized protein YndB with AHSA1/START domain
MSLSVTTRDDREIVLSRMFNAPRTLVFDAWTTPSLLMRWYGARGWNLVDCEVDLRVGGAWRFVSRGPDGDTMVQSGVYQQIAAPDRLVYTEKFDNQSYPGETLITHVFVERSGKTTVTSTLRYPSRAARDIVLRYPMTRGVGEAYDRLDDLLTAQGETP